ncbi:MAG: hypothetical protein QME51_01470 [Planctomycetota bacterium]|nr:hypothetical protein [Planctomycetota bacterium]
MIKYPIKRDKKKRPFTAENRNKNHSSSAFSAPKVFGGEFYGMESSL